MFISAKLIDYNSITTITLPLVNHCELRKRINDFIQKKGSKNLHGVKYSHLYKKLFQNNSCELAAFPKRALEKKSVFCGELVVCALSPKKGVVLCFIPSTTSPLPPCAKMIKNFHGKNYPNCNNASTCLFSRVSISFLACEEGMIDVDTNGSFMLQGFEISFLKYYNADQTLFCRKFTSNLLIQSPSYIMGEIDSDYILIDCICREKKFHFQVGLPVFSQAEVAAKVCSARQARAASLNFHCLSEDTSLSFMTIFPNKTTHHVVSFPDSMCLSLPFGLIEQGQLLLSQKEEGCIFEYTSISDLFVSGISDLFVSGEKKSAKHLGTFYDWQVGSSLYIQTNQSIKNITYFSDPSVIIVRKEGSKEFFVVGAQIKLICSTEGVWGVCFVKEGAPSSDLREAATLIPSSDLQEAATLIPSSDLQEAATLIPSSDLQEAATLIPSSDLQEAATLIPCTKKKSNLVMEQGPSHSVQSSSYCDPNEGPFSYFLQSSLNCDPEEGPSQGAKKRSEECLGLHFFDQDLLWSSDFDSGKGPFSHCDPEEGSSSHSVQSSSYCDPNEGPSSHCDPEEGPFSHFLQSSLNCDPEEGPSQGAKKRSAECLGLHFFDQDLLWSSDFDPGKGPSSQGAKKRSEECLGLKCAGQDPL